MTEEAAEHFSKEIEDLDENHEIFRVNDALKTILEEFIERLEGGEVLDVGCGTGKDTEFLADRGLEVTGVDLSKEMIDYCRENRPGEFVRQDIREMDFDSDSFDGIWCSATIFFIPKEDMRDVIADFREILKPDGLLYINFKQKQGESPNISDKEHLQHLVSSKEAHEMLEENGFKIEKSTENRSESGSVFLNFFARPANHD